MSAKRAIHAGSTNTDKLSPCFELRGRKPIKYRSVSIGRPPPEIGYVRRRLPFAVHSPHATRASRAPRACSIRARARPRASTAGTRSAVGILETWNSLPILTNYSGLNCHIASAADFWTGSSGGSMYTDEDKGRIQADPFENGVKLSTFCRTRPGVPSDPQSGGG